MVLYFFCFLFVLQTFRCATLLAHDQINQFWASYATALLTALLLGKTVFILDKVSVTKLFDRRPVFTAVIYKTILFTIATNFILCVEHLITHHEFSMGNPGESTLKWIACAGAHQLALLTAFGLFFTARELDSALGKGTISRHLFGTREKITEREKVDVDPATPSTSDR